MTQPPIKMLSIDDKMLTTDLDRAGYRNMGFLVRLVSSFQQAQKAISENGVDIIVINSDYEKIDALAICQHFKSSPETQHIPIVITSVQTSAAVRNAALDAGADLFVEQPIPRQYFIEKLKKTLDQVTRGTDRINLQEKVSLKIGDQNYELPIGDISSSGMLVATEISIANGGEKVELSFAIPGYRKPIEAHGIVVRRIHADGNTATKMSGFGIKFESFKGDSKKRLEKYVSKTSDHDGKMIYYL